MDGERARVLAEQGRITAAVLDGTVREPEAAKDGLWGVKRPSFDDTAPAIRKAMRANKGKHTKPEMIVRRLVHGMGYRYRLHRKDLPGTPDIALGPRRAIIEVRGCFWHRHPGCPLAYTPKTRTDFWRAKFDANVARDTRNTAALEKAGWRILTVWECETSSATVLTDRVRAFLESEPDGAAET